MYNSWSTKKGGGVLMLLSNVLDTKGEGVGGGIPLLHGENLGLT